jgi:cytochrome P450
MVKLALGDGLLASDGEYWRKQRQLVQSLFQPSAVPVFEPIIQAHLSALCERWDSIAASGETIDAAAEMTSVTLSIICEALFGARLGSQARDLCEALNVLLDDLGAMGCTQINTPLIFSSASRKRFGTAKQTLDKIVGEIVEEKRSSSGNGADLLSVLLAARDAETGAPLGERQIRDEVVTMLVAGHETTALALSWGWSLLARHPEQEQRLHRELDGVLGDRSPALQDVSKLPFTLMVLQEAMRLYPPVWFIARKSTSAGDLAGCDVPGNVLVLISPYAMHRHPGYWNAADDFAPSRFAPGAERAKYSYLPFGGGRHLCLGMHVALIEGPLLLAALARRYTVTPVAPDAARPRPAITLRLHDGLPAKIRLRPRQGAS